MAKIKQKPYDTPFEFALDILSGKWKARVIWHLSETKRFGELEKSVKGIRKKALIKELRELELAGIVAREVFAQVPPKVEYSLTDAGRGLLKVYGRLSQWADDNEDALLAAYTLKNIATVD